MKPGFYVYAIVPAEETGSYGAMGLDEGGAAVEVRPIVHDGIGALVSPHALGKRVSPTRSRLDAHYKVLREAGKHNTVIPIAFGHVASLAGLRRLLHRNRDTLRSELEALQGQVQMCVRIDWDAENLFDYFVSRYEDLSEMRDLVFSRAQAPTQMQKIELGRMFDQRRTQERELLSAQVLDALAPLESELRLLTPQGERRVAEIAVLVKREKVAAFEAAVYEIAAKWPNGFVFDFSGPFPPFDFVSVELDLDDRPS